MAEKDVLIRYNTDINKWEMKTWSTDYPIIYFPANQTDKKLKFQIEQYPGDTVTRKFLKDDLAIGLTTVGNSKPTSGQKDVEFTQIKTTGNNKTLSMDNNVNGATQTDILYALYFESGTPPLDPIIQNGGPPPSPMIGQPDNPGGTSVAPGAESQAAAGYGMGALLIVALIAALIGGFLGYSMGKKAA